MEIIGLVTGRSKPKSYKQYMGYGYDQKVAIFVTDPDGVEHSAMLLLGTSRYNDYYDLERKVPYIGDSVRYTTRGEKNGWGSITGKQQYEILDETGKEVSEENCEYRQEQDEIRRREYIEANKERWAREKEAEKQNEKDRQQGERDSLPDEFQDVFNSNNLKVGIVKRILRDTYHLGPISEGEGGMRDDTGLGCGHPGTGMRRPSGSLYDMPATHRGKYLRVLKEAGYITGKDPYTITSRGLKLLSSIDRCPECGEMIKAYRYHYYHQTGARSGFGGSSVTFLCSCQKKKEISIGRAPSAIGDMITPNIPADADIITTGSINVEGEN